MFFVFDGIDGAGKSTQLQLFIQWLESAGRRVVSCKDPGSTALGEKLRSILLGKHDLSISNRAEMMLFTTARTQLVDEIILPALDGGQTVVLDRYIFSTIVYQGHAGDLAADEIRDVNYIATQGCNPDMTFILDIPVDTALGRLGDDLDRMESRGREYFEKVRQGFLEEADRWPTGVEIIDATQDVDSIQTQIRELATRFMTGPSNR